MVKAGRVSRTVIKPQPGFRAELPGLDLATLIQMTCARRERLVVRVSSYGEEGFLYSADGRLVHATVGDLAGDEAVLRMLAWATGEFSVCERPFPLHPSVATSTEGLLLRAAQRVDEAALDRETDSVLGANVGLAEELEGEETPETRPYAPLPALSMPPPKRPPPPPPPRSARPWPVDAAAPKLNDPPQTWPLSAPASLLQVRSDDDVPTLPTPAPRRDATPTRDEIVPPAGTRKSAPPGALPPVSLGRLSEPPGRRSEPPPQVTLPRPIDPVRAERRPAHDDQLASVRIDARGEVRSSSGGDEQLAQLVAYVSRIAALVQADFALDPFDALHAELSGKRVLIYKEDDELVGTVWRPGSAAQELRQKLGV
jgi:hypothetical protein